MIHLVVGARPNLIKLAPLVHELRRRGAPAFQIVHTGQHYDDALSGGFFRTLDIPAPDANLGVGPGSQGAQTGRIMEGYERLLVERRPSATVVFGDVTSTMACALAAVKLGVPVVHVESGLRSFDRTMPEEVNRLVTDAVSDLLLVSEPSGLRNLEREGARPDRIKLVGNIMIDSLRRLLPAALASPVAGRFGLEEKRYALLTLHRPSNVDDPRVLRRLMALFDELAARLPILFPVHPRTRTRLEREGLAPRSPALLLAPPLDYVEALSAQRNAALVLTDSGGMQEETAVLGVPCLTLRENTERPITVELGTSTLVGNDPDRIREQFDRVLAGQYKRGAEIPLWDGQTAGRIADALQSLP